MKEEILQAFHKEVATILAKQYKSIKSVNVDTQYGGGMRIVIELKKVRP